VPHELIGFIWQVADTVFQLGTLYDFLKLFGIKNQPWLCPAPPLDLGFVRGSGVPMIRGGVISISR